MNQFIDKANVLVDALPYIRSFYGKTVVIKYGGAAMLDSALKNAVMMDIALMKFVGMNPVVVHGGGPEISSMMKRMGLVPEFVDGLRVTDAATMELAEMVLVGKTNKEIVAHLNSHGAKAVGLSGKDGALIRAKKRLHTIVTTGETRDLGFVGDVETIDPSVIEVLTRFDYVPVVAPIGYGEDGQSYNINADSVAGELAVALEAHKLVLLTDVEGIMTDRHDKSTLISTLTAASARELIGRGKIEGGMIPKVEACLRAIEGGVSQAHIIDGRLPHALLLEVFTREGVGTMVVGG